MTLTVCRLGMQPPSMRPKTSTREILQPMSASTRFEGKAPKNAIKLRGLLWLVAAPFLASVMACANTDTPTQPITNSAGNSELEAAGKDRMARIYLSQDMFAFTTTMVSKKKLLEDANLQTTLDKISAFRNYGLDYYRQSFFSYHPSWAEGPNRSEFFNTQVDTVERAVRGCFDKKGQLHQGAKLEAALNKLAEARQKAFTQWQNQFSLAGIGDELVRNPDMAGEAKQKAAARFNHYKQGGTP